MLLARARGFGKLIKPGHVETIWLGQKTSKRLHIHDRKSGLVFLIDTGSDVSILPVGKKGSARPSDLVLFAANDTRLRTFGEKRISPNLNLRRDFTWNFVVAAVPYPIIGADLLAHYKLAPFLHESRLVDTTTGLSTPGFVQVARIFGVSAIDQSSSPYAKILSEFPEIIRVTQTPGFQVRDMEHHILTRGPPISERARLLSPDKLLAAKKQYKEMLEAGICKPSSSPWQRLYT